VRGPVERNCRHVALLLLALAVLPSPTHATDQESDLLVYGKDTLRLGSYPLETYLSARPERKPNPSAFSTANYRGYVATWRIDGGKFWLADVRVTESVKEGSGSYRRERVSVLHSVVDSDTPVVAEWCTDTFNLPYGSLHRFAVMHMFGSDIYDTSLSVKVTRGAVERAEWRTRPAVQDYRQRGFVDFRRTPAYDSLRQCLLAEGRIADSSQVDNAILCIMLRMRGLKREPGQRQRQKDR